MKKDILKRVLCLACCLSLTLGMFAYRPAKAQAVVIDATAAFGAAAVTAAVNGTTATTVFAGMGTSAATGTVIGLMDTYAAATGVAASGAAFASSVATGILVSGGVLLVGAAAAALIGGFIDWLREQEGLEPGGEPVVLASESGLLLADGSLLPYVSFATDGTYATTDDSCVLCWDTDDSSVTYELSTGYKVKYIPNGTAVGVRLYSPSGSTLASYSSGWHQAVGLYNGVFVLCSFTGSKYFYNTNDNKYGSVQYVAQNNNCSLTPRDDFEELPDALPEGQILAIDTGLASLPAEDSQAAADAIMQPIIDGTLNPTVTIEADPTVTPDPDPNPDPDGSTGADPDTGTETDPDATTGWLSRILESIKALPQQIAEAVGDIISSIFAPDAELVNEITGTFSEKFGFVETLKIIGDDLFGMTPSSEPPVVWIHLEDAEGKYYYGGTVKALDMSWFQRYKGDVDRILGGFLWVAYLWLLFRRLPDILGGAGLVIADSQYIGDGMYVDGSTGEITGRFIYRRSKRL